MRTRDPVRLADQGITTQASSVHTASCSGARDRKREVSSLSSPMSAALTTEESSRELTR